MMKKYISFHCDIYNLGRDADRLKEIINQTDESHKAL
jgi:hypothetical protein